MDPLILSVDLGTTSLKLAIIDKHGHIIATSMREYELITQQASYVECSEETYWDAFTGSLSELLETIGSQRTAIKALGISAQGETLFFLDEKGRSLRDAIVWMDNRAEKESAELRDKFTDEVCYKTTGQVQFDPCWPAAKVLWVKKNQPEIFAKTKTFALIEDWFIFRLTGKMVTEGSLITSTVYWNLITKKWWPEMLAYLGISEDRLPKIMEPGEVVSIINKQVAEMLGLNKDVVICTGALDQAAAAIGIGNICEGRFSENIGAALAICAPVSKPLFDPNRKMPLHYFGIPNMYMLHTFTTGGMAIKWFRDSFCEMEKSVAELAGKSAYMLMDDEAAMVPAGSDGLVALPHLSGSMAPDVNAKAKGVFFGFTMKHGKPHFIRAIMESVGYIIRRNIEA
ncbi:MAG TPA: FGGY family carbohydrate kinase, partial [Leptolinea sp.]